MFMVAPPFWGSAGGDHPPADGLTYFQTAFKSGNSADVSSHALGAGTQTGAGTIAVGYYEADFVSTAETSLSWTSADLIVAAGSAVTIEWFMTITYLVANPSSSSAVALMKFANATREVKSTGLYLGLNPIEMVVLETGADFYGAVNSNSYTPPVHYAIVYRPGNTYDVYLAGTRVITAKPYTSLYIDGTIKFGGTGTNGASAVRVRYLGGRFRRAEMYTGASFTPPDSPAAWGLP